MKKSIARVLFVLVVFTVLIAPVVNAAPAQPAAVPADSIVKFSYESAESGLIAVDCHNLESTSADLGNGYPAYIGRATLPSGFSHEIDCTQAITITGQNFMQVLDSQGTVLQGFVCSGAVVPGYPSQGQCESIPVAGGHVDF